MFYTHISSGLGLNNGRVIITGTKTRISNASMQDDNLWIAKLTKRGKVIWEHEYGTEKNDWGDCICPVPDGGYLIIGRKNTDWYIRY
jgi:hypothetical protein